MENINNSGLDELVITNTIPLKPEAKDCPKIRIISIAGIIAESIRRVHTEESISTLFSDS